MGIYFRKSASQILHSSWHLSTCDAQAGAPWALNMGCIPQTGSPLRYDRQTGQKRSTRGAWISLFGMKDVKSLDRAVWERTRAVHYVSGDYMLRPWHNASTIAARMGGSVTDDQATSFFIPKRDIHSPL